MIRTKKDVLRDIEYCEQRICSLEDDVLDYTRERSELIDELLEMNDE